MCYTGERVTLGLRLGVDSRNKLRSVTWKPPEPVAVTIASFATSADGRDSLGAAVDRVNRIRSMLNAIRHVPKLHSGGTCVVELKRGQARNEPRFDEHGPSLVTILALGKRA